MVKKTNPFKKNKYEIKYILINSALVGGISLLSSLATMLTNSGITTKEFLIGLGLSLVIALSVALIKFKAYWEKEQKEYCKSKSYLMLKLV